MTKKKKIPTLDLHGCTREEVPALLDSFITKHKNQEELCIIVGKGLGIVKKETIKYLEGAHYPWRPERLGGIENPGALIIDLS